MIEEARLIAYMAGSGEISDEEKFFKNRWYSIKCFI